MNALVYRCVVVATLLCLLPSCRDGAVRDPSDGTVSGSASSTSDSGDAVPTTASSDGEGSVGPTGSSTGTSSSGGAEVGPQVRALITEAVDDGFSGAILVRVQGEQLALEGHGLANREDRVPNGPLVAFDFGSVMKDYTAAAVFLLQQDGQLSVDDTLVSIFPEAPADKANITLRQLLLHEAGFGEYHDTMGDFEPMTRTEARARIFAQSLLFEPGSGEAYSNSGFTLLADVVETVSGQSFTEYVREQLLEPAGMTRTGFFGDALWQRNETAVGYDAAEFQSNDPASWPYTWSLVGNGGLVSTVEDQEIWLRALWAGGVFTPAGFAAYSDDYLGVSAVEFDGHTVYAFAGAGDFGLGGVVLDVPASDTRVIVATNTGETFAIEPFAQELGELILAAL